ncbi:3'-5' exonuclease [uncultured Aquitalea sp.]|uniref:3'-5' exonuclease n=1 Tax=uncultured Aquitalea sp. TaxID=540272 RepID=UPI0025FD3807|nr:3'-5' exonuclease [uncultured Aquitalea sp.]
MTTIPALISLDIETLHQKVPEAAVIAIGAALFVDGVEQTDLRLSLLIDVDDTLKYGISDVDTMLWHIKQGHEHVAGLGLFQDRSTHLLRDALNQLSDWIASAKAVATSAQIITRDPDFDIAILNDKYQALGLIPPWRFYEPRSHRTREEDLRWMQELLGIEVAPTYTKYTKVAHDALADAVSQGEYLCMLYRSIMEVTRKK